MIDSVSFLSHLSSKLIICYTTPASELSEPLPPSPRHKTRLRNYSYQVIMFELLAFWGAGKRWRLWNRNAHMYRQSLKEMLFLLFSLFLFSVTLLFYIIHCLSLVYCFLSCCLYGGHCSSSLILPSCAFVCVCFHKGGAVGPRHSGPKKLWPRVAASAGGSGWRPGGRVCQDCPPGEEQGAPSECLIPPEHITKWKLSLPSTADSYALKWGFMTPFTLMVQLWGFRELQVVNVCSSLWCYKKLHSQGNPSMKGQNIDFVLTCQRHLLKWHKLHNLIYSESS